MKMIRGLYSSRAAEDTAANLQNTTPTVQLDEGSINIYLKKYFTQTKSVITQKIYERNLNFKFFRWITKTCINLQWFLKENEKIMELISVRIFKFHQISDSYHNKNLSH